MTSLNTEGVVRSLTFLPDNKLAIILDHEEAMLWKTDDCEAYKTFSREDFTVAIKRKVTPWTYIGKYKTDNFCIPILQESRIALHSSYN